MQLVSTIKSKYAVPINEYIQAHQDLDESNAKKRLKRSFSKDVSHKLSCLKYLKKHKENMTKKLSNPKTEVIFEIFKKKKCDFMCYT